MFRSAALKPVVYLGPRAPSSCRDLRAKGRLWNRSSVYAGALRSAGARRALADPRRRSSACGRPTSRPGGV